jgi:hypothetical protein
MMLLAISLGSSLSIRGVTLGSAKSQGEVVSWAAPAGEKLFEDYTLRVNGQAVPVYACRVSAMPFNQRWAGYQRPLDQTELAGFAYWGMSGAVQVEVTSKRPFQSVAVRPTSRGIQPTIQGQRISFRMLRAGQVTVELDGPHHALHLFADPPEREVPKAGDRNVLYFGPGVHRPGMIELKNGQTVYVAGGAVVYTAIGGRGVSGIRILGRGVIDSSEFERETSDTSQGGGSIHLEDCSDVKIDGVIIRDPDVYGLSAYGSRKVEISDVKLIGFWRYNSDGIHMCNSQDVTVRDSFVRSFDDAMVLSGDKGGCSTELPGRSYDTLPVRNIRMSGLVIWCDWGRSLEIGAGTCAPEVADIVFRDIDIIRSTHIAIDIQHSDRAAVHDIRYENIRVEVDDFNPVPGIQKQRDEKYNPTADAPLEHCIGCTHAANAAYVPNLFVIIIGKLYYSQDQERGTVRDVIFKDISVTGKPIPSSSFTGFDAEHDVRGVTIENLRFNGRPITSAGDAHLQIGKYVQGVRFVESGRGQ